MRTDQELFDIVATHLLKQKARSLHHDTYSCVYRADNGMKCAIGCLIPDEEYRKDLEGSNVTTLVMNYLLSETLREEFSQNLNLLRLLQNIHDNVNPYDWKQALIEAAKAYNFTMPSEEP